VIAGCEDNGIVGSTFLPSNPEIQVDTVATLSIETEDLVSYAGNKSFIAMGRYEDALFGTYEAVAMMTPRLITSEDSLFGEYKYGFVLRPTETYGDTLSTTVFDVYEIQQRWRAQEWKMDDMPVLGSTPITRFELGLTDSLFVEMPQSWADKYRNYYAVEAGLRDSAYVEAEFGLAFVPVSGNKISYLNASETIFTVERPDTNNLSTSLRQRASNYRLVEPPQPVEDGIILMNDFTNTGRFSVEINEDVVGAKIVSRAELVMFQDQARLNTTLPIGHTRFSNNLIRVFELDESEKEFYVTKDPLTSAVPDSVNGSYIMNITNLVNAAIATGGRTFNFYVTTDADIGIIRPNLILNSNAGLKAPRIIITKVESTQ
jgi:hypothetical protein